MLCVWTLFSRSSGNSSSNSGTWCLNTFLAPSVRVGKRCRLFLFLVFLSCISWLYLKKDLKKLGKVLFLNLYQNLMHWILKMSEIFNNFNSLNRGSVWELYLLFVMIRTARFCSLKILLWGNQSVQFCETEEYLITLPNNPLRWSFWHYKVFIRKEKVFRSFSLSLQKKILMA